ARASRISAALTRILPRWRGFISAQGPDSKDARAAATARSRSSLPASATSASVSPVAGLAVAKRLPEADGTNSPLMKRSVRRFRVVSVAIVGRYQLSEFSYQNSVISYQYSVISSKLKTGN